MQGKLEAIKRWDKGKTIKTLACKYGVHEVSVDDFYSSEKFYSVNAQIKDYSHTKFQKHLKFVKFCHKTSVSQKGNQLKHGGEDFMASVGWFGRWKKKYSVRHSVCILLQTTN